MKVNIFFSFTQDHKNWILCEQKLIEWNKVLKYVKLIFKLSFEASEFLFHVK